MQRKAHMQETCNTQRGSYVIPFWALSKAEFRVEPVQRECFCRLCLGYHSQNQVLPSCADCPVHFNLFLETASNELVSWICHHIVMGPLKRYYFSRDTWLQRPCFAFWLCACQLF